MCILQVSYLLFNHIQRNEKTFLVESLQLHNIPRGNYSNSICTFYDFPYTSTYTHMNMNTHISYVHGHAHLHTCINIKRKWGVTSHGGSTNFLEIFQVSIKRSKLWGIPKHCSYHNTKADWDCARFCDGACLFVFE